jgi:hypothetical protein
MSVKAFTGAVLAVAVLVFCGCVESLRSSTYCVSFPPARTGMPGNVTATSQREVVERLREHLVQHDFARYAPGGIGELWYRRGVYVFWETNAPGSITLRISSTHREGAVRRADQIEWELLRMFVAEPSVRIAFVESSK